jgi:hypothetical protein
VFVTRWLLCSCLFSSLLGARVASAQPPPAAPLEVVSEAGSGAASAESDVDAEPQSTAPSVSQPTRAVEVIARGLPRMARLRRSAYAVHAIEFEREHRQAADLGEQMARSTPVTVQREGGLGSAGRYSLNGLSGDRVRFFLDGVPLELAGFPFGIGNVPVNLIDRVEVYQGVVPVRFGADALGGAVHLVSDERLRKNSASVSYQAGSFDTHRLTLGARAYDRASRLFVRSAGFVDASANDYPVDVQVEDARGRPSTAEVSRFHDGYRATGLSLATGIVDQPWADRLYVQGFGALYDRELQHNVTMTVPYGDVTYDKATLGGVVRYGKSFAGASRLNVAAGHSYRRTRFRDVSRCRYDWYGRCFIELPLSGEIDAIPTHRHIFEHTTFARVELALALEPEHQLRLALAPTLTRRTGKDTRVPSGDYDPLRADRGQDDGVAGVEYETELFAGRVSNILFGKAYAQATHSTERAPNGRLRELDERVLRFGGGNGLRISLLEEVYLNASYEYATRLPTAEETFGDGALIVENPRLEPERSHNLNLGVFAEHSGAQAEGVRASVEVFARFASDLLSLLSSGTYYRYDNVLAARVLGTSASVGYTGRGQLWGVEARGAYQDTRNVASTGPYALFSGDRLPNLPFLNASGMGYARLERVTSRTDFLELSYNVRYVHEFLRGWESAGSRSIKLAVPSQLLHSIALSHVSPGRPLSLGSTLEVQNLTDTKAFDLFGVQRPGRAVSFKLTVDYE